MSEFTFLDGLIQGPAGPPGPAGPVGAGYSTIQDEGVSLAQRTTMNFVGSGVTVTDAGGKTVITITAGGGSLTPPANPADNGKLAVATAGNLTYALLTDAHVAAAAGIVISKLAPGAANTVVKTNSGATNLEYGLLVSANLDPSAGIALTQLSTQAALSVVGNGTNATAVPTALTAGTDGFVLRRSGTTVGFGTMATAGIADAAVTVAKLANLAGLSIIGRSANTSGVPAAITGTDGQALRVSGTTLGFGTLATAAYADNSVTLAKLATQAALTVLANATNATAVPTAVAAASDGQVFRRSGTTLGFGTITTGGIADGSITYAKIQNVTTSRILGRVTALSGVTEELTVTAGLEFNGTGIQRSALTGDVTAAAGSNTTAIAAGVIVDADVNASAGIALSKLATQAALSVVTNATNATAVPTAVAAASDGLVFLRSGTTLVFGTVATAGITNAAVTYAKIQNGNGLTVIGRSANSAGVNADITANNDGEVLRRSGATLGFGTVTNAGIDPAAAIAVSKLAPGTDGRVLVTTAGAAAWGFALGNNGDAFTYNGASHTFSAAGAQKVSITSTAVNLSVDPLQWLNTVSNPSIGVNSIATVAPFTGVALTVYGQDTTGSGGTVGGLVRVRGGNSTNGTGGVLDLRSGSGLTSILSGDFTMRIGSTIFLNYPGTAVVPTTGILRAHHNSTIIAGANSSALNRNLMRWGTTTDELILGDTNMVSRLIGFETHLGNTADTWISIDSVANTITMGANTATQLVISSSQADFQDNNIITTGILAVGNGPAAAGHIRIPNGGGSSDGIQFRNGANSGNILGLAVSGGDSIVLGDNAGVAHVLAIAGTHTFQVGGSPKFTISSTVTEFFTPTVRFDASVVTPGITQEGDATAGVTGQFMVIEAQGVTGTSAPVGGAMFVRGGVSINGVGGALNLRSGQGVNATSAGTLTLSIGGTAVATWAGSAPVASSGTIRFPSTGVLASRNNANSADLTLARTNSGDAYFFADDATNSVTIGSGRFVMSTTTLELNLTTLRFDTAATGPHLINIEASSTAAATGKSIELAGQDMTGTGATVGGITYVRAGNSTNGTGGVLELLSGNGVTNHGDVRIKRGSTAKVFEATATAVIVGDASTFVGLEHAFLASARDVIALCRATAVTTTQMPTNSGHGVVYIGNATTAPTANPVSGFTMFADSGGLWARSPSGAVTQISPA